MDPQDAKKVLEEFEPEYGFYVGIDSDGCAFDTMEIKHKECFIPNIIKYWGLQPVSKYAREAAEFVNLYSQWRGVNRFPALVKVFDLLRERKEVQQREVDIPQANKIREFIDSDLPLGNPSLEDQVEKTGDPELKQALTWSKAVNDTVADIVENIPPYPFVRETLEKLQGKADMVVISSTPTEALKREWQEHDVAKYVKAITGQEMGGKAEKIGATAGGNYDKDKILMIGDAPGDMKAAKANDALFYPIIPGREEESWERFYEEVIDVFLEGNYGGKYEEDLIEEFMSYLPETPPWE